MRVRDGIKRIGLVMAVLMIVGMAGAFASTSLWNQADDIAEDSASLVPSYTTINYCETYNGMTLIEENVVIIHGENYNDELTKRDIGEDDVFAVISTISEGLAFSPFADAAEDLDYDATGETELIDGKSAVAYEFEYTIDEKQLLASSSIDNGTDVDVSGSVWISEADGYVMMAEVEYSIYDNKTGNYDIEQVITYDYNGESWMPVQTVTEGTQTFTERDKTQTVNEFTLVETYAQFFEAGSYAR